jgi:hypothetical protein
MTGARKGGRPQRLVPGAQARWLGHGGIEPVARAAGTSRTTDKKETAVVADAKVTSLQSGTSDVGAAAGQALAAVHRHLDQCKLAPNTVKAYRQQTSAGRGRADEQAAVRDHLA